MGSEQTKLSECVSIKNVKEHILRSMFQQNSINIIIDSNDLYTFQNEKILEKIPNSIIYRLIEINEDGVLLSHWYWTMESGCYGYFVSWSNVVEVPSLRDPLRTTLSSNFVLPSIKPEWGLDKYISKSSSPENIDWITWNPHIQKQIELLLLSPSFYIFETIQMDNILKNWKVIQRWKYQNICSSNLEKITREIIEKDYVVYNNEICENIMENILQIQKKLEEQRRIILDSYDKDSFQEQKYNLFLGSNKYNFCLIQKKDIENNNNSFNFSLKNDTTERIKFSRKKMLKLDYLINGLNIKYETFLKFCFELDVNDIYSS
jgi:hypothetical protein